MYLEDELAQATAARDLEPQLLVQEPGPTTSGSVEEATSADVAILPAAKEAIARFAELEEKCRAAAQEVDRLDTETRETSIQIERLELAEARHRSTEQMSNSGGQASASLIWGAAIVAIVALACLAVRLRSGHRKPASPQANARALGVQLLGVVRMRDSALTG
jgi:hypothetical protein